MKPTAVLYTTANCPVKAREGGEATLYCPKYLKIPQGGMTTIPLLPHIKAPEGHQVLVCVHEDWSDVGLLVLGLPRIITSEGKRSIKIQVMNLNDSPVEVLLGAPVATAVFFPETLVAFLPGTVTASRGSLCQ